MRCKEPKRHTWERGARNKDKGERDRKESRFGGHHELIHQDMLMEKAFFPNCGASEDGVLLELQSLALGSELESLVWMRNILLI